MHLVELWGWKAHCFTPSLLKRQQPVGGVGIKGSNLNLILLVTVWLDILFFRFSSIFHGKKWEMCHMLCAGVMSPQQRQRGVFVSVLVFPGRFHTSTSFWLNHYLIFQPTGKSQIWSSAGIERKKKNLLTTVYCMYVSEKKHQRNVAVSDDWSCNPVCSLERPADFFSPQLLRKWSNKVSAVQVFFSPVNIWANTWSLLPV